MFDPRTDPLGLGLKQRARESRMRSWTANPGGGSPQTGAGFAPVLGEDWDAYLQATQEATRGKHVNFAGGTDASSDVDPNADAGQVFAGHSNQFKGTPFMPSLDALKRLTGKRGYRG